MLNIVKQAALDLCKIPKGVQSGAKEFSTHTVILVVGDKIENRRFILPGHKKAYIEKYEYSVFGLQTPESNILVVQDMYSTIGEKLTDADFDYFKDLNNFTFFDTMTHRELESDEVFSPIGGLVSDKPVNSLADGQVLVYKSAPHGGDVYVRAGSNRHKFITGKSNFIDDPLDFFTPRDKRIDPSMLIFSADNKNQSVEEFLLENISERPIPACMTLLMNDNIWNTVSQAIQIRKSCKSNLTTNVYWDVPDNPEAGVQKYSQINWLKVQETACSIKNNTEGYMELATLVTVEKGTDPWAEFNLAVFMVFWLLLSDETIDFIVNSIKKEI